MSKKDFYIIISLFLISFLIRIAGVSNVSMYWDEWIYWDYTNKILASSWAPTKYLFHSASPFLSYIEAAVTVFFGGDLTTLRVVSVIFGSLTVPLVYLFGKSMYDRKTGLLAALFMSFSAYHGLFSRVIMLEVFALFFVTSFLYFFWMSQQSEGRKGTIYAIIAGVMMGLALAAKYLPIFLVPAVFAYVLWTSRFDLKALFDKRIILIFTFGFLTFSPMLLIWFITGANPIYEYMYVIPESRSHLLSRGIQTAPTNLFITASQQITEIFTWDAQRLNALWTFAFGVSVILLIIATFLFYIPEFIKRERRASFLVISIFNLYVLILMFITGKYYLMYSFPFSFVMLSHVAIESFEGYKTEKNYKNVFRLFIILFTIIMFFSYFVTGVTAPYVGKNEQSWADNAMAFIKNDTIRSNYGGHIVIGRIAFRDIIEYDIYIYNLNASSFAIAKPGSKYGNTVVLDTEKINTLKPNYLIVTESQYNYFFINRNQKEIFDNYTTVFHSQTYLIRSGHAYAGYVLKRKDMMPHEISEPFSEKWGQISQDIYNESVPSVMKVGNVYTILVRVKNIGDSRTSFIARIHSEKFIIEGDSGEINLDKDSSYTFRFKIVPFREYAGKLPITADLYVKNEAETKVDSVTSYVNLIEK